MCDTDVRQIMIRFMKYLQVGMTPEQMRVMVMRFPALLGYSVEMNLRPTVSFLRGVLGLPMQHFARGMVLLCSAAASSWTEDPVPACRRTIVDATSLCLLYAQISSGGIDIHMLCN